MGTMKCFLLRYEEQAVHAVQPAEGDGTTQSAGTKTLTEVKTEAADADVSSFSLRAFPTKSRTSRNPASSKSRLNGKQLVLGAGTQTVTCVKAEATDTDPRRRSYGIFDQVASPSTPEPGATSKASPPLLGTQTGTRVRAEQADQDPGPQQFHAIPQCFSS